jgi:hypothetical protein
MLIDWMIDRYIPPSKVLLPYNEKDALERGPMAESLAHSDKEGIKEEVSKLPPTDRHMGLSPKGSHTTMQAAAGTDNIDTVPEKHAGVEKAVGVPATSSGATAPPVKAHQPSQV